MNDRYNKIFKEARSDEFSDIMNQINSMRNSHGLGTTWRIVHHSGHYSIDLQSPQDVEHFTAIRSVASGLSRKDLMNFLRGAVEALS